MSGPLGNKPLGGTLMGRTHESCERKRRQPRLVPVRVGLNHLPLSAGTAVLVRIRRGSGVKASTAEVGPQLFGRAPLVSCPGLWFSSLFSDSSLFSLLSFAFVVLFSSLCTAFFLS